MAKDEAGRLTIVQKMMLSSTDYLRRIIAPAGGQGGVTLSYLCPHYSSFSLGRLHLVGLSWQEAQQLVVCGLWRKYDWRAPNRLLVVQTGESASQAKVFKAHALPQGLCANLINALKLLANQQKDGDSPT